MLEVILRIQKVIIIIFVIIIIYLALSFDFLYRLFDAELKKTEMEVKYQNEHGKKTDYVCKIKKHKIAVSVTRAVGFPNVEDFDMEQAIELLKKKLLGLIFFFLHMFVFLFELVFYCYPFSLRCYIFLFDIVTSGILVSSASVTGEEKWERQILHIWTQCRESADILCNAYDCLHPRLRGDTIVLITVAGMGEKEMFYLIFFFFF
jgi:hypothetical protein